jgi:hypothetical protein
MKTASCLVAIVLGGAVVAAAARQGTTAIPDLEGGWVRIDTEGSGSFGGLTAKFPRAVLTPAGAALAKKAAPPAARFDYARDPSQPKPPGEAYIVTDGNCRLPSGVEPNSAALHIVQGRDEVLVLRENPDPGRHIFLDSRRHPDLGRWTPTLTGHSIGRYDNGELVVDTVGLVAGGVPAGGWRTPETRLIERFRLSADGTRLTVTYTWQDPKIYVKPHTYSIQMDRIPPGGYAFEWWCDSSDPRQQESVRPPEQRP